MVNPAATQAFGDGDWRSDAVIAYTILRLTFGINICIRGVMRIANGLDLFVADLMQQFAGAPLPTFSVSAFAHVLPFVEAAVGLLIVLGLWTRPSLIVGGLTMSSLTFGTMLILNYQNAWLQLTYAGMFFLLLVLRQWNLISLDAMRNGGRA